MEQVGIRELRQNLSVYVRRVKAGESLEVTESGRPVALLTTLPEAAGPRERLLAGGQIKRAPRSIAGLGLPPSSLEPASPVSEALAEQRGERL